MDHSCIARGIDSMGGQQGGNVTTWYHTRQLILEQTCCIIALLSCLVVLFCCHPSEKGAVESETIQLRLKWGGWQSSQSANPVVGLAGSGCRLPFSHLPPVTTSCVISQIRQLSGGLVTHLTQLLRCQLFHQSYVLNLSFLILKIKLLIYQLGILALCLLVKHCQNLK